MCPGGDSSKEERKSESCCDICLHKYEVNVATHVCKQCRLFFCHLCCSMHLRLNSSKDHVMVKLADSIDTRDLADISQEQNNFKTAGKTVEVDDADIVDSDNECQGLSTYFNAQENAFLSLIKRFQAPSSIQMICSLADGRICIHAGREIIIFSEHYHRLFAIECSPNCAVVHTERNIIAILDYHLTIDRLDVSESTADVIDSVKLSIPPGACSRDPVITAMHLSEVKREGSKSYPAFAFSDGQYTLLFPEFATKDFDKTKKQPPQWCLFSLTGKLLRIICLSVSFKQVSFISTNCQTLFVKTSDETIQYFNRYGGERSLGFNGSVVYTDGEYCLVITRNQRNAYNMFVYHIHTKKNKSFSFPVRSSLCNVIDMTTVVLQNKKDMIMVALQEHIEVIGLG